MIQTALQRGFVTEPDVETATQRQAELAERGVERSLWLLLQDSGALRGDHARRVERQQSSQKMEALEVDGYVIQGRVGRGGMGDVFLAQNEAGDEVAIKLLPANMARDEEYLARFRREVGALQAVEHPHITRFIGAGEIDGRPYLIMELIRGQSLKQRLQTRGAVGELPCRQLLRQLTPALAYAWQSAGLVHRDVKPANILINEADDGSMAAKLCDFGLAKFAIDPETTRRLKQEDLTQSGVAIGTPHYMSPEQATGDRSADPRHDIYGLGATIYHALLGKTLYSGGSSAVIMYQQATAALDMKPLSRLGIAPGFVDLLSRMLAKPRERRYQDWVAVQRDLDALDDTVLGPQPAADSGKRKPLAFAEDGTPIGTAAAAVERQRRSLGLVPMILVTVVVIGAAAGFVFAELEDATTARRLEVAPGQLAIAVEQARETLRLRGGTVSLRLQAGRYAGPWSFGAADQGLRLQAVGTVSVSAPHERPGLILGEGLRDFRIAGVTFTGATGVAIRSNADEADLLDCRVTDSYVVLEQRRGRLRIEGLHTAHCGSGLLVKEQSELDLSKSILAVGEHHLVADHATINLRLVRCLVQDRFSSTVIDVDGGVFSARGLIIEGGGDWTGIALDGIGLVQLADCRIAGGRFGLRMANSEAGILEGLTVIVDETAFVWSGPKPDTWRWSRLFLEAAHSVQGLPERLLLEAMTHEGASEEVLQQVPTLADDQDPS